MAISTTQGTAKPTSATFDTKRNAYVETKTLVRLSSDVYDQLERKHATFRPNSTSTELEAGYALGVQAVLKDLRAGFVVEG